MSELWQFTITVPAADAEAVSDAVAEHALAVDIDMIESAARITGLFSMRLSEFDSATLAAGSPYLWQVLENRDWLAVAGRTAGAGQVGRFTLVDAPTTATRLVSAPALYVESFHAFGDGYHATTQGCLRALEYVRHYCATPQRMADIGTGTGVLALAARKTFPRARIVASDIDVDAVAVTRRNTAHNAARGLRVVQGAGVTPVRRVAPFDVVLANILAGPLARMAYGVKNSLKTGGFVVLSGLLESQMTLILNAYRLQRLHCRWRYVNNGWVTLVLR